MRLKEINTEQEEGRAKAALDQAGGKTLAIKQPTMEVAKGDTKKKEATAATGKEVVLYKTPQNQVQPGQRPKSRKGICGPILL